MDRTKETIIKGIKFEIESNTNHPWCGGSSDFDIAVSINPIIHKSDYYRLLKQFENKFWHSWCSGLTEDGAYSMVMYKPSGLKESWCDDGKGGFIFGDD